MATPGNPVLHLDTSLKYLIPVPILTVIALALCIVRIWTRVKRTRKLYADDWLIVVAEVCCLCFSGTGTLLMVQTGPFTYELCVGVRYICPRMGSPNKHLYSS
jgi:hypothetical protein